MLEPTKLDDDHRPRTEEHAVREADYIPQKPGACGLGADSGGVALGLDTFYLSRKVWDASERRPYQPVLDRPPTAAYSEQATNQSFATSDYCLRRSAASGLAQFRNGSPTR